MATLTPNTTQRLVFLITLSFLVGCASNTNLKNYLQPPTGLMQSLKSNKLDSLGKQSDTSKPHRQGWHHSMEAAKRESAATGKPILADFTGSDWCSWCVKLKQDVFETEAFKTWAADNVVLLELDYPRRHHQPDAIREQNKTLKQKYNISSYPTVLLIDQRGNKLGKLGYMSQPKEWISLADGFIDGANTDYQRQSIAQKIEATSKTEKNTNKDAGSVSLNR